VGGARGGDGEGGAKGGRRRGPDAGFEPRRRFDPADDSNREAEVDKADGAKAPAAGFESAAQATHQRQARELLKTG